MLPSVPKPQAPVSYSYYYKSGSPGSLKFPKYKELRKAQLVYLRAE